MTLPIEYYDVNALLVAKVHPVAFRCSDQNGFYILKDSESKEVIGKGRSPARAWKNAADLLKKPPKKKGPVATRL